jgi:hypothetical protein
MPDNYNRSRLTKIDTFYSILYHLQNKFLFLKIKNLIHNVQKKLNLINYFYFLDYKYK